MSLFKESVMIKIHLNKIAAKTPSKTLWDLYPQRRHLEMPWDEILTHYEGLPKLTEKIPFKQILEWCSPHNAIWCFCYGGGTKHQLIEFGLHCALHGAQINNDNQIIKLYHACQDYYKKIISISQFNETGPFEREQYLQIAQRLDTKPMRVKGYLAASHSVLWMSVALLQDFPEIEDTIYQVYCEALTAVELLKLDQKAFNESIKQKLCQM